MNRKVDHIIAATKYVFIIHTNLLRMVSWTLIQLDLIYKKESKEGGKHWLGCVNSEVCQTSSQTSKLVQQSQCSLLPFEYLLKKCIFPFERSKMGLWQDVSCNLHTVGSTTLTVSRTVHNISHIAHNILMGKDNICTIIYTYT